MGAEAGGPDATPEERALRARRGELARRLLAWFDRHQRDMPWRRTKDPYAIWLSETMLQQTQVETVKPYYARFLERFPTVADLAAADLQEVLQLWAGLGYYRRARHLHAAARAVVAAHGGQMPANAAALATLPGVGRYTAGAVASIAYGERVPVVDGNVLRVLARLACLADDIAQPKVQQRFWALAGELVPAQRAGDYNQALMELGATVCVPGRPGCLTCPVRALCGAAENGRQEALPVKAKRGETPEVRWLCVVLEREGRAGREGSARDIDGSDATGALTDRRYADGVEVLVMQRPKGGIWEELWEFPAIAQPARWQAGVSTELERHVSDTLGVRVRLTAHCGQVAHQLTHRRMVYEVVRGTVDASGPAHAAADYQAARWVAPAALHASVPVARVTEKVGACAGLFAKA